MADEVFGSADFTEVERVELTRKLLHDLITSYADEADVFTELIQNAVDATSRYEYSGAETPQITVVLGRRTEGAHYVYVEDNGTGMSPEVARKVFVPGFSAKKKGATIGYKGVGLSYVAAISVQLAMWTRNADGRRTERTILHTHDWVMDSEKDYPIIEDRFRAPELIEQFSQSGVRGTGVYFQFHLGQKPSSLDNLVIVGDGPVSELRNWSSFLAAKTAIGLAQPPGAPSPDHPLTVRLVLDRSESQEELSLSRSDFNQDLATIGYPFPQLVLRIGTDKSKIDSEPNEGKKHENHFRKHQAIWHTWTGAEFLEMLKLSDDERTMLENHLDYVSGYLAYSTDVIKKINEILGGRAQLVRHGARLAVDGVPQGRAIDLSLTSDQGLDRTTHIVLGFSRLELDTGRKIISDEVIAGALREITQRVVTELKDYRSFLKKKDLPPISSDLTAWITNIRERRLESLIVPLLNESGIGPALSIDPASEQDVIALWSGLVASGLMPGYRMLGISGFARYDALFDLRDEALQLDQGSDYIAPFAEAMGSIDNGVMEFKHDFDDIITDFENQVKNPAEIDFVICWHCPSMATRLGKLQPVYGKWRHGRRARGVSYVWSDSVNNKTFQVIALKNLVAEILAAANVELGTMKLRELELRDEAGLV